MRSAKRREVLDTAVCMFAKYHATHKHLGRGSPRHYESCKADTEDLQKDIADDDLNKSIAQFQSSFADLQEKYCPRSKQCIEWSEVAVIADYLWMLQNHGDAASLANQNNVAWRCALLIIRRHFPLHVDCNSFGHAETLLKSTDSSNDFVEVVERAKDICNGEDEFVPCGTLIMAAQQGYEEAKVDRLAQEQVHREFDAANSSPLLVDESNFAELEEEEVLEYPVSQLQHKLKVEPRSAEIRAIIKTAVAIEKLGRISRPQYVTQKLGKSVTETAGEHDAYAIAPVLSKPPATTLEEGCYYPIDEECLPDAESREGSSPPQIFDNDRRKAPSQGEMKVKQFRTLLEALPANVSLSIEPDPGFETPRPKRQWTDDCTDLRHKKRIVEDTSGGGPRHRVAPRWGNIRRPTHADTQSQTLRIVERNGAKTGPIPGDLEQVAPVTHYHVEIASTQSSDLTDSTLPNRNAEDTPPTAARTVIETAGDLDADGIAPVPSQSSVTTPGGRRYSSRSEECVSGAALRKDNFQLQITEDDRRRATLRGEMRAGHSRTVPEALPVTGKLSTDPGPSIETLGRKKRPWDCNNTGLELESDVQHKKLKVYAGLEEKREPVVPREVLTLRKGPLQNFCGPAHPDTEGQAFQFTGGNVEKKESMPNDYKIVVKDGSTIAPTLSGSPSQDQNHYMLVSANDSIVSELTTGSRQARLLSSDSAQVNIPREDASKKHDAAEKGGPNLAATLANSASSSPRLNEVTQSETQRYDCGQNSFDTSSSDGSQPQAKTPEKDVEIAQSPAAPAAHGRVGTASTESGVFTDSTQPTASALSPPEGIHLSNPTGDPIGTADKSVTLPKEPSHVTPVGLASPPDLSHTESDCHQERAIPEAADNTTPKIAATDLDGSNAYKESANDKDGLARPDRHQKDGACHAVKNISSENMQQEVSLLTLQPSETGIQDYEPQEAVQSVCTIAQTIKATAIDSAEAVSGRKRKGASGNVKEGTLVDLHNSELPQPISRPASQNVHMRRDSEADQQQIGNVLRTVGKINSRSEDTKVELDESLSPSLEAPVPHSSVTWLASSVTWLASSSDARNPEGFLFAGQTPDNGENADRPTKKTKSTRQSLKITLDRETKRGNRKFAQWHQKPGTERAAASFTPKQQNQPLIKPSPITARLQHDEVVRHSHFETAKPLPINFNERINLDLLGSRGAEERCDVKESIVHMNVPAILLEFFNDSKQSQTAMSKLLTALENSDFVEYHAALYKILETADDDTLASLPQSAKVIVKYIKNRISDPHLGPVDQSEIHGAISFGWDVETFNHEVKKCVGNLFAVEKQSLQNWCVHLEIFNQQIAAMSAENNVKATATAHEAAELRSQLNDLQSTCLKIAAIWGTQQVRPLDEAFQSQLETNAKEFRDQAEAASTMAQDMVAFCDHTRLNAIRKCRLDTGRPLPHFRSEGFLENATSIRRQVTNWLNGLADEYELLQERLTEANNSADSAKETALKETSLILVLTNLVRSAYPQLELVEIDDVETFRQTSEYHTQAFQASKTAREEIVRVFLRLCNQVDSLIENRSWQELPQPVLEQHLMNNALRSLPVIWDRFEHLLKDYARMTQFCIKAEEKVKIQVFQQQPSNKELPLILWANLSGLVDNYVKLNDSETQWRGNAEKMERRFNETVVRNRTLEAELAKKQHTPEKLFDVNLHATMRPHFASSADSINEVLQSHRTFAEKLVVLQNDRESEIRVHAIKKHLGGPEQAEEKYYLAILSLIQDGKLHQKDLPRSTRQILSPLLERDSDAVSTESESKLLYDLCSPWHLSPGEPPEAFETFKKRVQVQKAVTAEITTALALMIQSFRTVVRDEIGDILRFELGALMNNQTESMRLESALKQRSDELLSMSAENNALQALKSAVFRAHPQLESQYDPAAGDAQSLRLFQISCEGEIVACKDARENFFQFYLDVRHTISGTEFLQISSQVVTKKQFFADTVERSSLLLSLKSLVGKYAVSQNSLQQLNKKLVRAMEDCANFKDMAHVKAEEVLGLKNIINEQSKTQDASNADYQHLEKKVQELEEEAERFKTLQQKEKKMYEDDLKDKVPTSQLEMAKSQLEEAKRQSEEAKSQLEGTKSQLEEAKSQLEETKSQLEEVRTSEQTLKDRYTSLSNELEDVKKANTKTEADLAALEARNRETVISTDCLQNKLRVLESQHKQLQEIQRTSASHQDELEKIRAAELTESRKCCEKLQTELQILKTEAASPASTGPLRHEILGNGTVNKASTKLLGKKPQVSMPVTHYTKRRRAETVPQSSHQVPSHQSYFDQARQSSLSAEVKNVSKANETKLAMATKQTKADAKVLTKCEDKKILPEADLQQLTDSIRELSCLISRYKDEELSSKKCMDTLLHQVQAIKEATSAGSPEHDMKQNIEALETELRGYKNGVDSFERVLCATKATTSSSMTMAETFEANEIEQRCLHAVTTYIGGLFGVGSMIRSEVTMSPANLERRLTSFAEAGSKSNVEKMQASLQTGKLSTLTDISKAEEKYAELQNKWERTARIAKRRKKRLENCLNKVKSTFVEAMAFPNDTKQKVIALCDQCTPVRWTVDPPGEKHRKSCLACEAIMAVLKFTRAKEDLRVNLLWELTAHLQKQGGPTKALGLEGRLRDAQLGIPSALHLCGVDPAGDTKAQPPKAYEFMFRTLQNTQAAALKKVPRGAAQEAGSRTAKRPNLRSTGAGVAQNKPEPALAPVAAKETKMNLGQSLSKGYIPSSRSSRLISTAGKASSDKHVVSIKEWCICGVMLKKQGAAACDVVMVQKSANKKGKSGIEVTVWIADAMDILEASVTGDGARSVADAIYSFCVEHELNTKRLPPGIRFQELVDNKPKYRDGIMKKGMTLRKLETMGPHVRAACMEALQEAGERIPPGLEKGRQRDFSGSNGPDPNRKLIQTTLDICSTAEESHI